jgi:hypothetical protein
MTNDILFLLDEPLTSKVEDDDGHVYALNSVQ